MGSFIRRYPGCKWWKYPSNQNLKNSIKEYGLENFSLSFLEHGVVSKENLCNLEIFYIKDFNSLHPNGYNYHLGGNGTNHTKQSIDSCREKCCIDFDLYDNRQGKIIHVHNLSKFCRDNKLNAGGISLLINGHIKRYKNYTLCNNKLKRFIFVSPTGKTVALFKHEIRKFSHGLGLNHRQFYYLCLRKRKTAYGWKCINLV